jgi:hypothetical protein
LGHVAAGVAVEQLPRPGAQSIGDALGRIWSSGRRARRSGG